MRSVDPVGNTTYSVAIYLSFVQLRYGQRSIQEPFKNLNETTSIKTV